MFVLQTDNEIKSSLYRRVLDSERKCYEQGSGLAFAIFLFLYLAKNICMQNKFVDTRYDIIPYIWVCARFRQKYIFFF